MGTRTNSPLRMMVLMVQAANLGSLVSSSAAFAIRTSRHCGREIYVLLFQPGVVW